MKSLLLCSTAAALLAATPSSDAALAFYYPLDEITGGESPDVVGGMDMTATNLGISNVVPGQIGNAISFSNANQTLLSVIHGGGDPAPVANDDTYAVSFWVNTNGAFTGDGRDLRLISMGSTTNNNPLFNLGTRNNLDNAQLDYYIRTSGGSTPNHQYSTSTPLDGTWHHILWNNDGSTATLYVDGVLDGTTFTNRSLAGTLNTTSIGGILRGTASNWVTGVIDDVAFWDAPVRQIEIGLLASGVSPLNVPEPSRALLLLGGIAAAALRRRR